MKYEIVREFPHEALDEKSELCISIYQPTNRHRPDNHQDNLLFKNNIQQARQALLKDYSIREVEEILSPLVELLEDRMFWNRTTDGMAVFLNSKSCLVYKLDRPLKNHLVISNEFHLKPLIRVYQSADNYYVLGISRTGFKLYFGNRYGLQEAQMLEEPLSFEEYIDTTDRRNTLSQAGAGFKGSGLIHGIGEKDSAIINEVRTYFRYVDKMVAEHYKDLLLPTVLAGLPENQGLFRELSHNKNILDKGLNIDYTNLELEDLRDRSWDIVEKIYLDKTGELLESYNNGKSRDLSDSDLHNIAKYAQAGRVETIMLESDRIIPGRVGEDGSIIDESEDLIRGYDVLDSLGKLVLSNKGQVVVLPKERMPVDSGAAAIYRY